MSAPLTVVTASGDVEISSSTAAQLAKRLQLLAAARPAATAFQGDREMPLELDAAAKRAVFDELTYWLDSAGPSKFPDDARKLFRALANEMTPGSI